MTVGQSALQHINVIGVSGEQREGFVSEGERAYEPNTTIDVARVLVTPELNAAAPTTA
jgi:hypothetical protein